MQKEWFEEWFDSPIYHKLYQNHNAQEAEIFIDNLLNYMQLSKGTMCLDLACGKGRHALQISEHGYDVVGMDISVNSIEYASQFANEHVSFFSHDMRKPFHVRYFDVVFNFFTSFGYFNRPAEHLKTLENIAQSLVVGGRFVIDFFNPNFVTSRLVANELKTIDGVLFHLTRWVEAGRVHKRIEFDLGGKPQQYEEQVSLFTFADFERMFAAVGLQIEDVFGNYDLATFDEAASPRMIIVCRK